MDDFDYDDCEPVDLDVTGDPTVDVQGYESPRHPYATPHVERDWLRQADADREQRRQRRRDALAQNKAETRQRVEQRPDLAPHVAAAVAEGMPGRDLGWWRVDVAPDGRAYWTRVDAPGDTGPRMTVEQTPAPAPAAPQRQSPAPQWHSMEMTEPSAGTQVW
jgi:hypothetical protein